MFWCETSLTKNDVTDHRSDWNNRSKLKSEHMFNLRTNV